MKIGTVLKILLYTGIILSSMAVLANIIMCHWVKVCFDVLALAYFIYMLEKHE